MSGKNQYSHTWKEVLFVLLCSLPHILTAQLPNDLSSYNTSKPLGYERTYTAKKPGLTAGTIQSGGLTVSSVSTIYFDGAGRPTQQIAARSSLVTRIENLQDTALVKDIIQPYSYDDKGRQKHLFMPFSQSHNAAGSFDPAVFTHLQQTLAVKYAGSGETLFYGEQVFNEGIYSGEVTESFAPGNAWVGSMGNSNPALRRSVKTQTLYNRLEDSVLYLSVGVGVKDYSTIGATSSIALSPDFNVPSYLLSFRYNIFYHGVLDKIIVTDEEGFQHISFYDKYGLKRMEKKQLHAAPDTGAGSGSYGWACTYYVYDFLKRLRVVIQPEGVAYLTTNNWQFTDEVIREQCFLYEYDAAGNIIAQKAPGAGMVYTVYDKLNRPVMTQDARQRLSNVWAYIRYDHFNRATSTGTLTDPTAVKTIRQQAAASTDYPNPDLYTGSVVLTRNYYDNYRWVTDSGVPFAASDSTYDHSQENGFLTASGSIYPYPQANSGTTVTKGLLTGSRQAVLDTLQNLYSLIIYNDKGMPVQTKSFNHSAAAYPDISTVQYGWAGQVLVTAALVYKGGTMPLRDSTVTAYTYDVLGRLITSRVKTALTTLSDNITRHAEKVTGVSLYDDMGMVSRVQTGVSHSEYPIRGLNH